MTEQRLDITTQEWRLVSAAPTQMAPAPIATAQSATAQTATDTCKLCAVSDDAGHSTVLVLADPHTQLGGGADTVARRTTSSHSITAGPGSSEVIVYSSKHGEQLGDMSDEQLALIVDVWAARYAELSARPGVAYVFVHADYGGPADRFAGHAHGGIHAYASVPPRPAQELRVAATHLVETGRCVLCDVVAQERTDGLRVIAENRHLVAYVPFAPRHAYEVHIAAHRHATSLLDLTQPERASLASLLRTVAAAYDALTDGRASWAMAMHQAPVDDGESLPIAHFHVEFVLVQWADALVPDVGAVALGAGVAVHAMPPAHAAAELRAAVSRRTAQQ